MHKRFHGFPSEKDAYFFPRRLPQALDCPPADAGLSVGKLPFTELYGRWGQAGGYSSTTTQSPLSSRTAEI